MHNRDGRRDPPMRDNEMTSRRFYLWLAAAASLASSGSALAAPLEKLACDALKAEHGSLLAAGVKTDMAKGADWGKANLPRERLTEIARLMSVEEDLSFRCGELVTARPALLDKKPGKEGPEDGLPGDTKPNAAAKPTPNPATSINPGIAGTDAEPQPKKKKKKPDQGTASAAKPKP